MKIKDSRILVTGGTGFIGEPLVRSLLSEGAEVICLTRKTIDSNEDRLRYINCDLKKINMNLRDKFQNENKEIDLIIYLAANIPLRSEKQENMLDAKLNTFDPFINFLNSFGDSAKKIIYASTVDVYGIPEELDYDEKTPIEPIRPYGIAKYCNEKYLEYYSRTENKQYVILRFTHVYGPKEPFVRAIPIIIDAAINDKLFTLYGSGEDMRKYLYVSDASSAIIRSANYEKNGIINIAGDEHISINQVICTTEELLKKKMKINQQHADKLPIHNIPNTDKSKTELGFIPEISFIEGMKRTIEEQMGRRYESGKIH